MRASGLVVVFLASVLLPGCKSDEAPVRAVGEGCTLGSDCTDPLVCAIFLIYWNIGLIAQWTFVRPQLRDGLIWDGMLRYQFIEVPSQAFDRLDDLIFHRCGLANNKTC